MSETEDLPIIFRHRQIVLDAERLGLMVRTAWLCRPVEGRDHSTISLEYLEPLEAWDALTLADEHRADPATETLLIEARLMTEQDVTNDMRYWNQRRRAIRRANPKTNRLTL